MEPYDISDPAWLDEFLEEDLKSSSHTNKEGKNHAFAQPSPLATAQPKWYKRSQSSASNVFASEEVTYGQKNDVAILLEKFRFLKKRLKLNLQKLSEILGVSKAELQKFSSGKDQNCTFLDRIQRWVCSPANSDALRCYERDKRRATFHAMPTAQSSTSQPRSFSRASAGRPYDPFKAMQPGQGYNGSFYYAPHPSGSTQRSSHVPGYYQNSGRSSSMNYMASSGRASRTAYGVPEQEKYLSGRETALSIKQEKVDAHNPLVTPRAQQVKNKWHNNESIEVLSQMLKRDTHKLLHKGIDSAIDEYLEHSKALRNRMKVHSGDSRQSDYFYKKQGKLLLNRLTAICGDEAVNRATSYLSELKSKRENRARAGRNWKNIEMQKLAHLTKAWNHACSCKEINCDYPNCRKIKPAVLHQLRLKDERRRTGNPSLTCTITNCEPCFLYNKLKKFSTTTTANSTQARSQNFSQQSRQYQAQYQQPVYSKDNLRQTPGQPINTTKQKSPFPGTQAKTEHRLTRQSPFQQSQSSYSTQNQSYSNRSNFGQGSYPNRSGTRAQQIYNQQNNINTSMQNINNTNVSYNTYNIHTNSRRNKHPVKKTEVEETDMSAVAEILDDNRKHNVNINVNVNVESLYGTGPHKRKAEAKAEYNCNFAKEKRSKENDDANDFHFESVGPSSAPLGGKSSVKKSSSFSSAKSGDIDPASFIPDVDEDLAALFPPAPEAVLKVERDVNTAPKEMEGNGRRVLCVVCHGKERDALFKPCNHCCACMNCALKLRACPMCRTPVDSTSHIFLS